MKTLFFAFLLMLTTMSFNANAVEVLDHKSGPIVLHVQEKLVVDPHSTSHRFDINGDGFDPDSYGKFLGGKFCVKNVIGVDTLEARITLFDVDDNVVWQDAVSKGCSPLDTLPVPIVADHGTLVCTNFTGQRRVCKIDSLLYFKPVKSLPDVLTKE